MEAEAGERERHERNQHAVAPRRAWDALQPGAPHVEPAEGLRQAAERVQGDEDRGLRYHVVQRQQDAVSAAQCNQPIVDESDTQVPQRQRRGVARERIHHRGRKFGT